MSARPGTQYASGADGHIAYQSWGGGPLDVLFMPEWYRQVEAQWDDPATAAALERLGSFARTVCFDPRGIGLSDPLPIGAVPNIDGWVDDVRVVLDAAGIEQAALVACSASGLLAIEFAARYPERTSALVLVHTYARFRRAPDFPIAAPEEIVEHAQRLVEEEWGTGRVTEVLAPSRAGDERFVRWFGSLQRMAMSPGSAATLQQMLFDADVRGSLTAIRAPTLILHRTGNRFVRVEHGRYLADSIPDARLVELAGDDHVFYAGDVDALVDEVESFLTGARRGPEPERVLRTLLFTDIVSSTDRAAALGDRVWRQLLDRHHTAVRRALERFRGVEVSTAGDGFFTTFESPTAAIRCACAIRASVEDVGLELRAGLHAGEVELRGDDLAGIAVHVAARVSSLAGPGEVMVTRTVKDLVAGSGIGFDDRGEQVLKGVPDVWHLYAVT